MHKALLYEKLDGERVRCDTCQWRCKIAPGKTGVCKVYLNEKGELYSLSYGRVSSVAVDPVEKKPLFHFYPGTNVFSLGGWGCNFHCAGCQNWQIACPEVPEPWRDGREVSPELAVELARRYKCDGIAWTYNEPGVWLEYTIECARLVKKNGLYTVYVTNGYSTEEALDAVSPYLDAFRVDIKGFSDDAYRRLATVTKWRGILDVAKRAREKWKMHLEVVTNVTPGINDDDEQLKGIAGWIYSELGELTPWHVTRFHPHRQMQDISATPLETLKRAHDIGIEAGLRFVYIGNVPGNESEATKCYSCGRPVVERYGYQTNVTGLEGSRCLYCGTELGFVNPKDGE